MSSNTLRRNPTRMALRWKLVPTKNHKSAPIRRHCAVYTWKQFVEHVQNVSMYNRLRKNANEKT